MYLDQNPPTIFTSKLFTCDRFILNPIRIVSIIEKYNKFSAEILRLVAFTFSIGRDYFSTLCIELICLYLFYASADKSASEDNAMCVRLVRLEAARELERNER